MLQALAVVFALAALACIVLAIAMLVRGDENDRLGYWLRAAAVVCFGIAVVLNVLR